MPLTTLRALHTTIGNALAELERVYQAHPGSVDGAPLDFPDLDVPYYATASSNPYADAAEKLAVDPAVVVAARQIVAACGQLSASVHQPFFSLVDVAMSVRTSACPPPMYTNCGRHPNEHTTHRATWQHVSAFSTLPTL